MRRIKSIKSGICLLSQLFLLIIISGTSCAQTNWSKLVYSYNAGSLPPPYHYSYTITVNSNGTAELLYTGGYQSDGKNTQKYSVDVSKANLNKLKNEIKESDILNIDIKSRPNDEIPDGGHSDDLKIFNNNDVINTVPNYPELKYESTLNKLYKTIINCVPDEIWNEVNTIRSKE